MMRFKKLTIFLACCLSAGAMAMDRFTTEEVEIHFIEQTFTYQGQEVTAVLRDTGGEMLELHSADQSEETLNFYEALCAERGLTTLHSGESGSLLRLGRGVQIPLMGCHTTDPEVIQERRRQMMEIKRQRENAESPAS